jgi:hypothetical protein
MGQRGQVLALKSSSGDEMCWAYRYRLGGRGSKRAQRGGFPSEQAASEALDRLHRPSISTDHRPRSTAVLNDPLNPAPNPSCRRRARGSPAATREPRLRRPAPRALTPSPLHRRLDPKRCAVDLPANATDQTATSRSPLGRARRGSCAAIASDSSTAWAGCRGSRPLDDAARAR